MKTTINPNEICFDMDGTIANLYAVEDWLPKLRAEDASPYLDAKPMWDMEALAGILRQLQDQGITITVITWLAKDSSAEYKKAVREAIIDLFTRNLWNELRPIDSINIGVNTRIAAWCEMHGIGLDRVETVRQKYYRIRDAYKKRGINLQNFTRNNSDKDP